MRTIELYFFTDALPEGCVLQHETWELPSCRAVDISWISVRCSNN